MPDLYDEAIERLAYLRIYGWVSEEDAKALTSDVLDAVAPAIAAKAYAAGYIDGVAWDGWVPSDEDASIAAQTWIEGKA